MNQLRGLRYEWGVTLKGGKIKLLGKSQKGATSNVPIVAIANKLARTAWAILAYDGEYPKGYVGRVPT